MRRTLLLAVLAVGMTCTLVLPLGRDQPAQAVASLAAAAESNRQAAAFPPELVDFVPYGKNPVFTAEGPGHWDVRIRERGWILREGDLYHLWFTGYDGTANGLRMLGYATSHDGITWSRYPENPIYREHWVEDMMVVKHDGKYLMFAEGRNDRAQLLVSPDGVHWTRQGKLDIRTTDGKPLTPGPYGTPTAWFEDATWYLFYERSDQGVWLATSKDLKVWTNVDDAPVLVPGPDGYDQEMIALNQIVKYQSRYYAYYHGAGPSMPRTWTTNVAVSRDLVHWSKYPKNPIVPGDRSSGILVDTGQGFRLYTMHDRVELFLPR